MYRFLGKAFLFTLALAATTTGAYAQSDQKQQRKADIKAHISRLESEYVKAILASDLATLQRLEDSDHFDKAIFEKVTFKTYETTGVTINAEDQIAIVAGQIKSERRNQDGLSYTREGSFIRTWRLLDGDWKVTGFEFRGKAPDFATAMKKRSSEVATDRTSFVGKPVRVTGRLTPQPNYIFFTEKSYFSFFLFDLENMGTTPLVVYVRRDSPQADELRAASLKGSGVHGEFDVYYSSEAYAATAKRTPYVVAELFGYHLLKSENPTVANAGPPPIRPLQTPRQIAQQAMPSTVWIVLKGHEGIVSGSGFFILPDVVATNYHVIEGMSEGLIKMYGKEETYQILGVVGFDKENDLALLKIKGVTGKPLPLNRDDSTAIGDEVYAVGNPEGLEGTFSQGIVSALRKSEGLIQITAPISHGSSGGAVLNSKGEVVGIAVGAKKDGQSLNFAIAVELLRRMKLFSVPKVLPVR